MDGIWLSEKILRIIRDKKQQTTDYVMQGRTTESFDYDKMIGRFRALEELEGEVQDIIKTGEQNDE
jgi:hypothetical protein|tara:strand:+ start:1222 stop:1419 length:198 start_codon:yes stop_codon:yes gene_type:complete